MATRRVGNKPARRVAVSESPIITLLTDFGEQDYFVGAVKGVILSANRSSTIVDISHDIPAQDVAAAAFTLLAVTDSFPAGTIHIAVVDPGVGSSRRALLIDSGGHFFVGPDNGIFSYVIKDDAAVYEVTNEDYFRKPLSQTFHGRDVFAPVAAALSNGIRPETLGKRTEAWVTLPPLGPKKLTDRVEGRIIHIDRFGNCITNLTRDHINADNIGTSIQLKVGRTRVNSFRQFYGEKSPGKELFAIWGSAGFLEISVQNKSAAAMLKVQRGATVQAVKR
ncbi:MAG TPA: SAM-dependent chlorinase/fluorinase [Pyrinomonadaceae bacterium]|nr:SAM-dependent chlorinase/fluorinase [Pyrinomonadaceae bacterium]